MDEDETIAKLERDLTRARWLLRDWRDKHGGREALRHVIHGVLRAASPSDLLRETNHFLEGKS